MIQKKYIPLWIAIFSLGGWLLLSALSNTSQFGDNFEQFNWAQSAEWGYWKHPPLTTWLLIGFQSIFGFHFGNAYALSFLCLYLTLYLVWKTAQQLLPDDWAGLCVLLLSMHQMWTWRAQLYNHNVVLVMMVSACTCLAVHLLKLNNKTLWKWALLGVLAGLAVLTKYQAVVPLGGLLFLILFYVTRQGLNCWPGLGLAFFVFSVVLLPHVLWIYQTDFLIFHYSTHTISGGPWTDRLLNLLSFSVQQLKYVGLMLLVALTMKASKVWTDRHSFLNEGAEVKSAAIQFSHLMWALILFPAGVFIVLNQSAGVRLQNHWGMQLLLFLPLFLAWHIFQKNVQLNMKRMLRIYVCIQVVNLILFVMTMRPAKPGDVDYPAQIIADTVVSTWHDETTCPLLFISGPPFEAGMASVYSEQYPSVIDEGDLSKSPWVSAEMLEKNGYVKMSQNSDSLRDLGQVHQLSEQVQASFPKLQTLHWVNVLPKKVCD